MKIKGQAAFSILVLNNRLNPTDGPLFLSRFSAILVDSDAYFLLITT